MIKRSALMIILVLVLSACNTAAPAPQENKVLNPTNTFNSIKTTSPITPTETSTPTPIPTTTKTLSPTKTPTQTATPIPLPYGPDNFPANVNPLTGLIVGDPTILDRRPVAVKIQMVPRGQRPPWGVSRADIVFDYYQNFGSTRFNAIFYGQDAEHVGPIRSARLFDISILRMYKSIFAFGGADHRIFDRIIKAGFGDTLVLEWDCPPMCRIDPSGYNFLETNTKELTKYTEERGVDSERPNLDGMSFDPQVPSGGQPGEQIFVRFNYADYNRWDYNASSGRYLRFQDTQNDDQGQGEAYEPLIDRMTEEQISADNVVILYTLHQLAFWTSWGPSEIVDINARAGSKGKGYAFRDGQVYQVLWQRPAQDSMLILTHLGDGSAYTFKPGNTWYQIIGYYSPLPKTDGGTLRFTFSYP